MDTIPLRDAIRTLRAEILSATEDAANQALRFQMGPIEMEFQVVAKREIGGDAKLSFHIFVADASVGGSGKGANEQTQKVKFTLTPVILDPEGNETSVQIGRRK